MHPRRSHFLAFILLLTFAAVVHADKVDDFVKAQMEKQHLPGVSIVVIKDGKIVKMEGYGLANIELNVPARPETVYKIGSVSKQFIATGIMLLIEEGKISLDDNIGKFLEGTPESWKPITIRHLLTHTSGIVREAPGFDPLKIQTDADVIKTAYSLPLRFTPGEKYEYCNVGYFTLAEIISKVSGKPWGDFLNERVFTPLGMTATRTTTVTDLVPNRANGYVWRNGKMQNATIFLALRPSGAFLSTVIDLAKWDEALNNGKLLKRSTLEQMWTPLKLNDGKSHPYGFGWQLEPVNGHKQVNHGGSLPGFRAQLARFIDDKVTVVVLTNGDNADAARIAQGVANFYIAGLLPDRKMTRVDGKILDGYAGQYQGTVTVSITRNNEKLILKQGEETLELVPESETNFFVKDGGRTLFSFVKDATGQLHLAGVLDGREIWRLKKVK